MSWSGFAGFVLGVQMLTSASQAAAVSTLRTHAHCTVVDAAKLPPEAGGPAGLCAAIERAVAAQSSGARFTAEVKVISNSRMAAVLVVNGKALPELNFAIMDRRLDETVDRAVCRCDRHQDRQGRRTVVWGSR